MKSYEINCLSRRQPEEPVKIHTFTVQARSKQEACERFPKTFTDWTVQQIIRVTEIKHDSK